MRTSLVALVITGCLSLGCGGGEIDATPSAAVTSTGGTGGGGAGGGGATPEQLEPFVKAAKSCAYECATLATCPEVQKPYECPALGPWKDVAHAAECPAWDGTLPTVVPGKCTATAPTGPALRRPGVQPTGERVLPDGREATPAGVEWIFDEPDVRGGLTAALALVPGTQLALVLDNGAEDSVVRAVDLDLLASKKKPVTSLVSYPPSQQLAPGIAIVAPDRIWVGQELGFLHAITLDPKTGKLTRDDASSITLPKPSDAKDPWYVSGVAAHPSGKHVLVSSVTQSELLVIDVEKGSPTFGTAVGRVDLGGADAYAIHVDKALGRAYVPLWGDKKVVEVSLADPKAPTVVHTYETANNPQGMVFLDSRWAVVANDLSESLTLLDRVSFATKTVPAELDPSVRGSELSALAWDGAKKRLYATLAGANAVSAFDVDVSGDTPTVAFAGRVPTGWWPSSIAARADGTVVIGNLRGHGVGPLPQEQGGWGADAEGRMRGSVQAVPFPDATALSQGDADVKARIAVGAYPGYPKVECPAGVKDFPVPASLDDGPSPVIKHIYFIVRENKTFDALLGDMPGVDGDPSLTLKGTTPEMDSVWANLRSAAKQFAHADNFYNLAMESTQGHNYTTYGRGTDFCERTRASDARKVPLCGVGTVGRPEEGSLFEWLAKNDVRHDVLGEIVGGHVKVPAGYNPVDTKYPGGPFQNITYNDSEKSCYLAGRLRASCNLASPFAYITFPNDHTIGVSPKNPTPETMCAVNDQATGMFLDALSHSPHWPSSLVVITEDDPQQGGDHVDYHRVAMVMVSPWVKRGYVSKTHIDVASLHKVFAHVLGKPYPNLYVKNAGLPLDLFTSTPDYTPFTYKPRSWPLACGSQATKAEITVTESWDFSRVDAQPGLGAQVGRWMRGKQLTELSPRLAEEVAERNARRAAGLPPPGDDDDDD